MRIIFFFFVLAGILLAALAIIILAQGYRPDFSAKTLRPTGLLVATSNPDGAQLWLDGKLKSATNTTLNLPPGRYEVEIKKDGFTSWKKALEIKKELVTQTDAYLFSTYPDLKALTFTGAANPLLSPDGQKVVFSVSGASLSQNGLWVLELADRPLGLSREPRLVIASAPGGRDFAQGEYQWSPDSKQILVTLKNRPGPKGTTTENFLLEADRANLGTDLVDVSGNLSEILKRWGEETRLRHEAQLSKLPKKLLEAIESSVKEIQFSPDESKILYTATASASIPEEIIPPLPGASSQKEARQLESGKIYVYDLKEDKNFLVMDNKECKREKEIPGLQGCAFRWFPTSKHLLIVQMGKIGISEHDGTNLVDVYSGPFENSFAFPFPDGRRLLALTSIGKDTPPNLYAISLR